MSTTTLDASAQQESATSDSRKRKVAALLESLDASKFIPSSPAKQASFAPWDRTALSTRLLTFRTYPVHTLASPIHAFALAKSGWTCLSTSTIACSHCHARIVILVETKLPDARRALEARYASIIKSGHMRTCPWTQRTCDETLLRVPLADSVMSLDAMQARVSTFDLIQESDVAAILGRLVTFNQEVEATDLSTAQKLALYGWSIDVQGTVQLLTCEACHRRLLLPKADQSVKEFDLAHYEYCPWINAKMQGEEAGWKALLRHHIKSKELPRASVEAETLPASATIEENRAKLRNIRRRLGFLTK